MGAIDEMQRGSYRGIECFFEATNEDDGFDGPKFEYPGSNNFKFEQLGLKGRIFNPKLIVRLENRDAFDNALKTPGPGLLVVPEYKGTFIVKVGAIRKQHEITKLGVYEYSVEFFVEKGLTIPTAAGITAAIVSRTRAKVLASGSALLKSGLSNLGF